MFVTYHQKDPWSDPTGFYSHLTSQIYRNRNVDCVIITGDFNSQIGKESDSTLFDSIIERKYLDPVRNSYGDSFIDFLKDLKLCVTNGHISSELHNFTTVGKGKAVVDYIVIPHDCLKLCEKCEVKLMSDIMEEYDLIKLLTSTCKQPDHSVISLKIRSTSEKVASNPLRAIKNKNITNESLNNKTKRFKFDNVPSVFMNNPDWTKVSHEIITNFENANNDQKDINFAYSDMCN